MTTSPGPTPAPPPVRRRRARWWWIGALVALVAVGAAVVAAELEHRAWVETVAEHDAEVERLTAEAETSRARAQEAHTAAHETLTAAIDEGRAVHRASTGQVDDPSLRDDLASALAEAENLRDTEATYPVRTRTVEEITRPNPFRDETLPSVEVEMVEAARPAPAELDTASDDVSAASTAVAESRRQWAYDELQAATIEARDAMTDLSAQGTDDGELAGLSRAVDDAEAILDAGVADVEADDAVARRDTLLETTESLWSGRLEQVVAQRRQEARTDGIDCREDKCVALTFDDGPVAETQRLLRILERKEAPATFFMVGANVSRNPDIARAVVDGGHLVANHTWNHPQLTTLDDAEVRDELRSTSDAIREATGVTPFLLRPPYGDVDPDVRGLATRTGLDVMLWSLDTLDWETRDAKETRRRVREQVEPGSNVLLHDIHASTVDAVPGIIEDLRDQDYVLVTADLLVDSE